MSNKNKPMLEKALEQSEPKLLSEFFLSESEKRFIRNSFRNIMIKEQGTPMLKLIKQKYEELATSCAKKLGLGNQLIEEINSNHGT